MAGCNHGRGELHDRGDSCTNLPVLSLASACEYDTQKRESTRSTSLSISYASSQRLPQAANAIAESVGKQY
ncbi:unnamed protein product [Parajaminaea phylloscopi]